MQLKRKKHSKTKFCSDYNFPAMLWETGQVDK